MRITGYGLTVLVPDPDALELERAGLVNRSSAYPRLGWPTSYRAAVELAGRYPPLPIFELEPEPEPVDVLQKPAPDDAPTEANDAGDETDDETEPCGEPDDEHRAIVSPSTGAAGTDDR